ncbi:hypothetical protein WR25_04451 [Diploscapter pachys]|uniref:Uncharacterized protein n=1 Tax=Diploscapter pachys TaxID=2018661 RepID=A0A2A2K709_9BILA|nr:hypothetical protein WR25_04451 [Diploscapter pachys]
MLVRSGMAREMEENLLFGSVRAGIRAYRQLAFVLWHRSFIETHQLTGTVGEDAVDAGFHRLVEIHRLVEGVHVHQQPLVVAGLVHPRLNQVGVALLAEVGADCRRAGTNGATGLGIVEPAQELGTVLGLLTGVEGRLDLLAGFGEVVGAQFAGQQVGRSGGFGSIERGATVGDHGRMRDVLGLGEGLAVSGMGRGARQQGGQEKGLVHG